MHVYVSTSLSSLFSLDILTHIHTLNLTDNIRVLHAHTHMNTFRIIITIVDRKQSCFSLMFLCFCQISCVYVVCRNCCIIVELTPKFLIFAEPLEILFLRSRILRAQRD